MSLILYFVNRVSCIVFCAQPMEVGPTKLNFNVTKKCFDSTQIYLTHYQTTNFRLFQDFADNNFKFDKNGRKLSKPVENTVGKEKLLVTSNFFFSHSVFKRLVSQGCQKVSLCGNGLINNGVLQYSGIRHRS